MLTGGLVVLMFFMVSSSRRHLKDNCTGLQRGYKKNILFWSENLSMAQIMNFHNLMKFCISFIKKESSTQHHQPTSHKRLGINWQHGCRKLSKLQIFFQASLYFSDFVGQNLGSIFKCLNSIARKKVRNVTFTCFEKQIAHPDAKVCQKKTVFSTYVLLI